MPEVKFTSKWLKARENVQHGDYVKFLDAGVLTNAGTPNEKWTFKVSVIPKDNPSAVGPEKDFTLNKTNFKAISAIYGTNSDNWVGKQMRVGIIRVQNMQGQMVAAVRLSAPGMVEQAMEPEPEDE